MASSNFNATPTSLELALPSTARQDSVLTPAKAAMKWRILHYPQQIWWAIACFIALVAFFQFASWVALKSRLLRSSKAMPPSDANTETAGISRPLRKFSWRNVPSAVINAYRVVAFRYTLNIGQSYTLNMAEVFITCIYIAALVTWEIIYSKCIRSKSVVDPSANPGAQRKILIRRPESTTWQIG